MGITLRLAWRNIWRHPRRTFLTASAIAFAVAILLFMVTLQLGSYDMMIDSSLRLYHGHLQVQPEGYLDKPRIRNTISDARALGSHIRKLVGSSSVSVRAMSAALASSRVRSYGVQVIGVETDYEGKVSTIPGLVKRGRFLSSDDAAEAIIGHVLARNLKVDIGGEITLLGTGMDGSVAATVAPVVGIFESGSAELDRHLVQLPLGAFQDVFSMRDRAHTIVVLGDSLDELEILMGAVRAGLPPESRLAVLSWEALVPGLKQAIQADWISGWFLYACLIMIVTFSIMNTFLMSVLERTREFGIMLALGAKPVSIGALIMLESTWLTLLGVAVGMTVGIAIVVYFHTYGFTYPGMEELMAFYNLPGVIKPEISTLSLTLGPAVVLLATCAAALYPALRIRLLKPVEAMRAV
ncbi:MAG: ABC transporter permease [Desulfobacterales bacterium]|nr:ABC transporter permease [Desulfobacterales bacterium]